MSASMIGKMFLRKRRILCSYLAFSSVCRHHKRLLHEAPRKIAPATYQTDTEGCLIAPSTQQFPDWLDMDPEVQAMCESDPLHYPKKHPGILLPKKPPDLPKRLVKNARKILEEEDLINNASFEGEVKHLQEVYLRRKPPLDDTIRQARQQAIAEELFKEECERMPGEPEDLTEDQMRHLQQRISDVSRKILSRTTHQYKPIDYTASHVGLVFLAARLAANYTVLHRVFHEIAKFDTEFTPGAVLNVGSGTGSAVWAANNTWKDDVNEYYNVDTSNTMNDLARKLLAYEIHDPVNLSIRGAHFRQFIPSPQHEQNRFPLVLSAYLLMEQPTLAERLQTVSLLWELTENYLVLVEHGTNAGYQLLQEARHIILQMGKEDGKFEGHLFAPCSHDEICPKLQLQKSPCTFSLQYRKLNTGTEYGQGDVIANERYSYLVFKKGPRPKTAMYPRVTGVLHKSTHSHCHTCCPDGSLRHWVISKAKPSVHLLRCAKRCTDGDLLPVRWPSPSDTDSNRDLDTKTSCKENSYIDSDKDYTGPSSETSDKPQLF